MSTSLVLGNGNTLINIDEHLQITDLYWPHVGKNNHLMGHHIRTYFWDYGQLVSFEDTSVFKITPAFKENSISGNSIIESEKMRVRIVVENTVLPHKDIYIARYTVTNFWDMKRDLKFFMNHDFYLKEHNVGDTTCWYPLSNMLFHYKDNIYMGIGSTSGISQYGCGQSHSNGGVGSLPNSTTGKLTMWAIDRGAVESTIGFDISINPCSTKSFDYIITCGHKISDCVDLFNYVKEQGTDHLLEDTGNFWKSYVVTPFENFKIKNNINQPVEEVFDDKKISERIKDIFLRSIGVIRTQIDNDGAVIAGNDSSHLKYRKDSYCYLWHRDAALTISVLDKLGYTSLSEKFFRQCATLLEPEGFFLHTYTSTGSPGTSWHPWVDSLGNPQLPIQEDETGTVLWALWKSYENHHNQELISELWDSLIKPAADFLCGFRYSDNKKFNLLERFETSKKKADPLENYMKGSNLPLETYDIWEEVRGIHTYTCASVYGGLIGASILALKLGQHDEAEKYATIAHEIREAVIKYLYDEESGHFIHGLYKDFPNNKWSKSMRADSSISGLWFFEMLSADDSKVVKTMEWLEKELWNDNSVGGIIRYDNDDYYRQNKNTKGNPWFITTLWFAQYYIKREDNKKAEKYLQWVVDNISGTDLISEQIDCNTGIDMSIKPLTWSHAEFIRTVYELLI
ncbi:MAG: glycoside hydrolase family 15 protein [bacterium]